MKLKPTGLFNPASSARLFLVCAWGTIGCGIIGSRFDLFGLFHPPAEFSSMAVGLSCIGIALAWGLTHKSRAFFLTCSTVALFCASQWLALSLSMKGASVVHTDAATPEFLHSMFSMRPSLAACFILIIGSMVFFRLPARKYFAFSVLQIFLVATIAIFSIMSYLKTSDNPFDWHAVNGFEFDIFLFILLLSAAHFAYYWVHDKKSDILDPFIIGSINAFACLLFSVFLYQHLAGLEYKRVVDGTASAANHFRDVIQSKIRSQAEAIERMAHRWEVNRWEVNQKIGIELWFSDVMEHLEDLSGFEAIGKTDSSGKIVLVKTKAEISYGHQKEIEQIATRLKYSHSSGVPKSRFILSEAFAMQGRGQKAVAVIVPLFHSSKYAGVIFAVVNVDGMFQDMANEDVVLPNFNFVVSSDKQKIYVRNPGELARNRRDISLTRDLRLGSHLWRLSIIPKQSYLETMKFNLQSQVFIGGLLLSLLVGFLSYLLRWNQLQKQQFRTQSNRLQAILDGSTRVAMVTTDLAGVITSFNIGAEKMLGYSAEEVVNLKSSLVFHLKEELKAHGEQVLGLDRENVDPFAALIFSAKNGDYEEKNWTYVTKSGKKIPVNLIVTAIRQGEEIVGYLEIALDVTLSERKLRRYAKKLESTNQELEEFSYIASHDLKEPVRNLVSYSNLLKQDIGESLSQDAEDDLRFIVDAAKRMNTLVDDLLHLSRAGRSALKLVEIDLNELFEVVLVDLRLRLLETKAEIEILGVLPTVLGDQTLLTLLFNNLISNGIKFVSEGVVPKIIVRSSELEDRWEIEIEDNGIGMKEEYLEQIFKPFKRLHGMNTYKGTGIGLSICRKAVERHQGSILVLSEPGKGSMFKVTLPKSVEES